MDECVKSIEIKQNVCFYESRNKCSNQVPKIK